MSYGIFSIFSIFPFVGLEPSDKREECQASLLIAEGDDWISFSLHN